MAAGQTNWPYVINLGNSIIGVSVLAMPFCFKECGVILGMLLLLCCGWLTHISCKLLVKAAFQSRRRSYQYLAFHAVGQAGKLFVEICMIGLLLGTCIAFFVIMGDLGPAIVSKIMGIENTDNLRTGMLIVMAMCISLPLALLRNLESLSNINAISLGFYTVFIAEVFTAAFPNLWSGLWVTKVSYWNPEGVFKCLPIFSLAFSCQTQLFVMYDALAEPSLQRMTHITKSAIGMCMSVYMCVGFFGYVAFCDDEVLGDILLNFHPTIFSEAVKFGFVLAVAVSFPLMVFPCRASIYTLCFAKTQSSHDNITGSVIIPSFHFNIITAVIVMGTMVIGILTPNIEFILAMTGATMGSLICYIFPAIMFISIMSMTKTTNKATAQFVLFLGVTILLASTYVTLNTQVTQTSVEESVIKVVPQDDLLVPDDQPVNPPVEDSVRDESPLVDDTGGDVLGGEKVKRDDEGDTADKGEDEVKAAELDNENLEVSDKRQEPPNPQAPRDVGQDENPDQEGSKEKAENNAGDAGDASPKKDAEDTNDDKLEKDPSIDDAEAKEAEAKKKEDVEEANSLLKELKEQQEVQKQLIEEQKEIIQDLKQHQKEAHGESVKETERQEIEQQPVAQKPIAQDPGQQPVAQQAQQPIGQEPINPAHQPIGQQADVNQAIPQPVANQGAQQPIANQDAQQPIVNQAAQQPIVNQGAQQPIVNQAAQQPIVNQATQQPIANQGAQQPIVNQAVQQPIVNQAAQQPIVNQAAQQPIVNQGAQQPIANQDALKPIAQQTVAKQLQPIPQQQAVQQQAVEQQQVVNQPVGQSQHGAAEALAPLDPSVDEKLNILGNNAGKQFIVEDTRGSELRQPVAVQQDLAHGANSQVLHGSQNIQRETKKSSGNAGANLKKSHVET